MIAAVNAQPAPFVPVQHKLTPGYALLLPGFGAASEHAEMVAHIRDSLPDLSDPVIETITRYVPRKTSPASALMFYRLDGAYCRPATTRRHSAVAGRHGMRPSSSASRRTPDHSQCNAPGSGDGIRSSYGLAKYQLLAKIKAEYDTAKMFHLNANIPPLAV